MNKVHVSKDKSGIQIKATCNNILCILYGCFLVPTKWFGLLRILLLIEEFLIISHLYDYVAFESVL